MVRQNFLLIVLILILAALAFVWYQFFILTAPEETTTAVTDEFEAALQDLRRLNNLEIDTEILQNPVFGALESSPESTTTSIRPGRENPFLPF